MKSTLLLQKLITKVKKEEYKIDYEFSFLELINILSNKLFSLVRGQLLIRPLIKGKGFIFAEKGVKVKFGHKIEAQNMLKVLLNILWECFGT